VKLQKAYPRFRALGAKIVALSVEALEVSARLAQVTEIEYPILADPGHQVLEAYGVYNLLGDGRAVPSMFIVDEQGVIVWEHIGRHKRDWPDTEVVLERLGEMLGG